MKRMLLFALTMAIFPARAMEGEQAPNPEDDGGNSPLHLAAREKSYEQCFALLADTSWIKERPEKAIFSLDAVKEIQSTGNSSDPQAIFKSQAAKKMSLFMVTMKKYITHQRDRATAMKTALNAQADTPLECAQQAKAPKRLMQLLDPDNFIDIIPTLFFKGTGVGPAPQDLSLRQCVKGWSYSP